MRSARGQHGRRAPSHSGCTKGRRPGPRSLVPASRRGAAFAGSRGSVATAGGTTLAERVPSSRRFGSSRGIDRSCRGPPFEREGGSSRTIAVAVGTVCVARLRSSSLTRSAIAIAARPAASRVRPAESLRRLPGFELVADECTAGTEPSTGAFCSRTLADSLGKSPIPCAMSMATRIGSSARALKRRGTSRRTILESVS